MKKKIGFFMGSFDPIHIGHIALITGVLGKRLVDELVIVPAMANPGKKNPPEGIIHREAMISSTLISELADFRGKVQVTHGKGEADPDGKYYSYRQLREILEANPGWSREDLYIIAGTDTAKEIPSWKNSEEILAQFKILEVDRPGWSEAQGITCSSSGIRKMIAGGLVPTPWVTAGVWETIKTYGLYGSGKE